MHFELCLLAYHKIFINISHAIHIFLWGEGRKMEIKAYVDIIIYYLFIHYFHGLTWMRTIAISFICPLAIATMLMAFVILQKVLYCYFTIGIISFIEITSKQKSLKVKLLLRSIHFLVFIRKLYKEFPK